MTAFQTRLNPIIPVGRLIFMLFMIAISVVGSWATIEATNGGIRVADFFLPLFSLYMAFLSGRGILTQTKTYCISSEAILVTSYIPWQRTAFPRDQILGYSRSTISLRVGQFQQIKLHLSTGHKLLLPQFSYFNFKRIEPALVERQYPMIEPT